MGDFDMRRYVSGDEQEIIWLFQEVFKKSMGKTESIKHWNWEYKDNPSNRIEIILAIDKENIVGHYAVIPVKMKIKDEINLMSLSLDTMTHKDYRGRGIFPKLASKLYKELGESGISITFGFPNKNSINGFISKLNWVEISDVPIQILPLNFKNLIYRYFKNKAFSNFLGNIFNFMFKLFFKMKPIKSNNIIKINDFDNRFNKLWDLAKNEFIIGIVRDKEYLNWRYFQKPEENYIVFAIKSETELKGYITLKIENRFGLKVGLIMDILTIPSNISFQNDLITHAIYYFKKNNVDIISIIMFPHWRYYNTLKSNGFIKMYKVILPEKIYFGARLNNSKLNRQFIMEPKNWYLTWGDTDVV